MTPDDAEEMMHDDDDDREAEWESQCWAERIRADVEAGQKFEREQDAIAADIARTNQERRETRVWCSSCDCMHPSGHCPDPFAGVRAGHALLDDVKRIFGATEQQELDDMHERAHWAAVSYLKERCPDFDATDVQALRDLIKNFR